VQISKELANLDLTNLSDNIYHYPYKTKHLRKLIKQGLDFDNPNVISTYSSFKGEVYENIVYELLLRYAKNSKVITKFVLKGPHQNSQENIKNGFGIDIKDQIVYKSGYKDISEFDGLFFINNDIYFVESTITKVTTSLRKRLRKKKALLEELFPSSKIKTLIIVTHEATGTSVFPDYCIVWKTKPLNIDLIIDKVLNLNSEKLAPFMLVKDKKFIETKDLKYNQFRYFNTLHYVLKRAKKYQSKKINIDFLKSKNIDKYFDILTKLYIGYINTTQFLTLVNGFDKDIEDDRVMVTVEKKDESKYVVAYFLKPKGMKLQRVDIDKDKNYNLLEKEYKGFSTSEAKYLAHIIKPQYQLELQNIIDLKNNFEIIGN